MRYGKTELKKALEIMGVPDQASVGEIRKLYIELMFRWHPDRCKADPQICKDKAQQIQEAYKMVLFYCENFRISFREEDLRIPGNKRDAFDFWVDRFGDDPLWGSQ